MKSKSQRQSNRGRETVGENWELTGLSFYQVTYRNLFFFLTSAEYYSYYGCKLIVVVVGNILVQELLHGVTLSLVWEKADCPHV